MLSYRTHVGQKNQGAIVNNRIGKLSRALATVCVIFMLVTGGTSAATAGSTTRVCAGNKCVTVATSKVCKPSSKSCVNGQWLAVTGYCSPSVGCVTIDGKNLRWVGTHKTPTAAEAAALRKCTASLGVSIAAAYAGPGGWAIAGIAMSFWGCTA